MVKSRKKNKSNVSGLGDMPSFARHWRGGGEFDYFPTPRPVKRRRL